MKSASSPWILPALFVATFSHGQADTVKFGHLEVIQLTSGNEATDITLTKGSGSSTGWSFRASNRGDFGLSLGYTNDTTAGVPITCVTENNGRDNSGANGGEATGLFYATSATMADNTEAVPKSYRVVTHKASVGPSDGVEANFNSSFAFFPYVDWYAGRASNSARTNGGANNLFAGHAQLTPGEEFFDLGGGQSTLDLRGLGEHSSGGVLLVNHAKDEANYALSRANADGTFTMFVHDNGSDASTYEQDPIAFAYVPMSKVGTNKLVAAGRILGDASAEAGAGNFVSTKGTTGTWILKIPGYTHANGVLLISPEGGVDTNVDNIISYEWSAAQQGWLIQSRDLSGTAMVPSLQNLAATTGVYSFAFFSDTALANQVPTVSVTSPANGANHPAGSPLVFTLNAADADGQVAKVEIYEGGAKIGEITQTPFTQWTVQSPVLGEHTYLFKVTDNLGAVRTSSPLKVNVVPQTGQGSLYFDGMNDYVTFGDAPDLKLREFTLECWFRREGAGISTGTGAGGVTGVPLIAKGRGENDNRTFNCNYFLGINSSGMLVADFEDYSAGLNHPITGVTPTVAGQWYHAAVSFDGTMWRLYLNGVLEAESSAGGEVPEWVSIQHAGLGTAMDSNGVPEGAFSGFMDEVRIWDHARSGAEIAATKDFEVSAAGGLRARFGFDQSSGTSLQGSTAVTGTLVNGPVWTPAYGALTPYPNQFPTVALQSPAAGVHYQGVPLVLRAAASDADGSIAKVGFYDSGVKIGEVTTAPFEMVWNGVRVGAHTVTARATDNGGATSATAAVAITVKPPQGTDGLYFDGVDDYVTFGNNSGFGLRQFTLETWLKKEVGGISATSGSGGVSVIPLISHGRGENDNNTFNCNYLFGIREGDGVLAADFEEGPGGASPGANHPVAGITRVAEGVWNHAAATYDGTTWRLYLNGNLEVELAVGQETAWNTIQHAALGTGLNSTGVPEGYFHGSMDETRIWNRARTLSEIRAAMTSEVPAATGLVARYGMNSISGTTLASSTGSHPGTLVGTILRTTGAPLTGNVPPDITPTAPVDSSTGQPLSVQLKALVTDPDTAELTVKYYTRRAGKTKAGEDFTLVALPDTQYYSAEANGANAGWFSAQTDWIVSEMDARDIKFVFHLGDITDQGQLEWQWANATNALYRLENRETTLLTEGMPYSVAVGNHDQYPNGNADGSTELFNTYFGVHPVTGVNHFAGKSYYGGTSEPAKADNNYTLFSAGGLDFMVVSLEYDTTPDPEDLEWADSVLKAYPSRRAIIVTHHMVGTGNPASFSALGQALYDRLKVNPNLMMMHGGHIHGEGRRVDTYNGRAVHAILADYQSEVGGNGWLRILKFSPKNNRVDIQTYSPTLNQYKTGASSQFSLDLDLSSDWSRFQEFAVVNNAPAGQEASVAWNGLEPGTRYEWYATVSDGDRTYNTAIQHFVTEESNAAPQVELTRPLNGGFTVAPATVTLGASASDDVSVAKVEFYSGTVKIGEDALAPYAFEWQNVPAGSYTLFAKAIDGAGLETLSSPVAYTVEPGIPTVAVAATDASAGEFGADTALAFTFSRTGPATAPLTVAYTTGGTATVGADYSGTGVGVTFAAGETTATVALTVLADDLAEGDETVILGLADTADYLASTPASATAVIADKPSQAWLFANLAGNPNAGPTADADGDGVANLLEYYYGTRPDDRADHGLFQVTRTADPAALTVRYQRAKAAGDVSGSLRWSSNLKDWHGSGESDGSRTVVISETVASSTAELETVEATVQVSAGAAPERIFVRLTVQ